MFFDDVNEAMEQLTKVRKPKDVFEENKYRRTAARLAGIKFMFNEGMKVATIEEMKKLDMTVTDVELSKEGEELYLCQDAVVDEPSTSAYPEMLCPFEMKRDAYIGNAHLVTAINACISSFIESYNESIMGANPHEYHEDFVEDCEECHFERDEARSELGSMNSDYERSR